MELRRQARIEPAGDQPLSDEQLAQLADESFAELDRREAAKTDDMSQLCPKCGGRMEQGFTIDMGHGSSRLGPRHVSAWARGAPVKSLWFLTYVLLRNTLSIGTFRCESCGYLESFAREEFAARGSTQFSLRSLLLFVTVLCILLGLIVWAARS